MLSFLSFLGGRYRFRKAVQAGAIWWQLWRGYTGDADQKLHLQEGERAQEARDV